MALYEFRCQECKKTFEQITKKDAPDYGTCPDCGSQKTEKLISTFKVSGKVGGRKDLRESTDHGCHGPVYEPNSEPSRHSCNSHCHHGESPKKKTGT